MPRALLSRLLHPLTPAIVLTGTLCLAGSHELWAQAAAQAQAGPPVVNTVDGGTSEVLQSIFIPPIAGAPFSLTLETEWSRPFGTSGGTVTVANRRHIMRDGVGRLYQERWILVPKNSKMESRMNLIQIGDPNAHTLYNCFVFQKRCELVTFNHAASTVYQPSAAPTGPLPNGEGQRTREDLGQSNVAGVETVGYRETTTINAGVLGNDQAMVTTREFWYSPRLQISLLSTLDSPHSGKQQFRVTEISPTDPDPRFFNLPEGYTVVDLRNVEPPRN